MEPWHFSHGEPEQRMGETFRHVLQWSHGILAMESSRSDGVVYLIGTLQWSHGILAMERTRAVVVIY